MKLPVSDKQASFGKKAHVKKGYYPAKLVKVSEYKDADGNLKEGKYGRQLIFDFAIFKADPETGAPIEPMTFEDDSKEGPTVTSAVVIADFVYHQYKDQKTGEYRTAITPNSAITKLLKALGWVFSTEDVEIDNLIGNWAEVNLDDYDAKNGDDTYKASTVKDVNPYEGPEVSKDLKETITPGNPKKQDTESKKPTTVENKSSDDEKTSSEEPTSSTDEIQKKKDELLVLKDKGLVSEKGYKMAIEQIDAEAKKK